MLLKGRQADPKILTKLGMTCMLFFFLMNLLPHPTSTFGDGLFDGVRGALMGAGATLLLWAAYLNGKRRRERSSH